MSCTESKVLIVAKCNVNAEELDKIKTMWEY